MKHGSDVCHPDKPPRRICLEASILEFYRRIRTVLGQGTTDRGFSFLFLDGRLHPRIERTVLPWV